MMTNRENDFKTLVKRRCWKMNSGIRSAWAQQVSSISHGGDADRRTTHHQQQPCYCSGRTSREPKSKVHLRRKDPPGLVQLSRQVCFCAHVLKCLQSVMLKKLTLWCVSNRCALFCSSTRSSVGGQRLPWRRGGGKVPFSEAPRLPCLWGACRKAQLLRGTGLRLLQGILQEVCQVRQCLCTAISNALSQNISTLFLSGSR